jgi:hypothetical protein
MMMPLQQSRATTSSRKRHTAFGLIGLNEALMLPDADADCIALSGGEKTPIKVHSVEQEG